MSVRHMWLNAMEIIS